MHAGNHDGAPRPPTQLPQGRYPASPSAVWAVVVLAVLLGLALGVGVPAALTSDSTAPSSMVGENP